jgi:hypothetical protein
LRECSQVDRQILGFPDDELTVSAGSNPLVVDLLIHEMFCLDTTDPRLAPLNPGHLLDVILAIGSSEACLGGAVFQFTLSPDLLSTEPFRRT